MRKVNKKLSEGEMAAADVFYKRIGEKDTANVQRVIRTVDSHADEYLRSDELEREYGWFKEGGAFFLVGGIGGNITKKGRRPDIDILVATNMRYETGFLENDEPIWKRIKQEFGPHMEIEKKGELPDDYNIGVTKGKCVIELRPRDGTRKIDLVYAKSMGRKFFSSEREFHEKDVGEHGAPLDKVILYRAGTSDIRPPRWLGGWGDDTFVMGS